MAFLEGSGAVGARAVDQDGHRPTPRRLRHEAAAAPPMATPVRQATPWTIATEPARSERRVWGLAKCLCGVDGEPVLAVASHLIRSPAADGPRPPCWVFNMCGACAVTVSGWRSRRRRTCRAGSVSTVSLTHSPPASRTGGMIFSYVRRDRRRAAFTVVSRA